MWLEVLMRQHFKKISSRNHSLVAICPKPNHFSYSLDTPLVTEEIQAFFYFCLICAFHGLQSPFNLCTYLFSFAYSFLMFCGSLLNGNKFDMSKDHQDDPLETFCSLGFTQPICISQPSLHITPTVLLLLPNFNVFFYLMQSKLLYRNSTTHPYF